MHRDVILVGASRGGIDAFTRLAGGLTPDLQASVLFVMHLLPSGRSYLAERLSPLCRLPVKEARDGEVLEYGCIYVCVPDRHLMVERDHVRLVRGPKESHARPSVDVLFRSAAYWVGPRAIGIVLTGNLDDGTSGLWAIKDRGGIAMVQSPQEAPFPSMPRSALDHVKIDYELRVAEMPDLLRELTRQPLDLSGESVMSDPKWAIENTIALQSGGDVRQLGKPSLYSCPECHGSMVAIEEGALRRYRCHTGHGFTQEALHQEGLIRIEKTLYAALAQVEEQRMLQVELAAQADLAGKSELAARCRERATRIDAFARRTRNLVFDPFLIHPK